LVLLDVSHALLLQEQLPQLFAHHAIQPRDMSLLHLQVSVLPAILPLVAQSPSLNVVLVDNWPLVQKLHLPALHAILDISNSPVLQLAQPHPQPQQTATHQEQPQQIVLLALLDMLFQLVVVAQQPALIPTAFNVELVLLLAQSAKLVMSSMSLVLDVPLAQVDQLLQLSLVLQVVKHVLLLVPHSLA